jgi:2-succinyl-5-enolpyruvyl-6-hydroxy-3-cyclohexene-1-carboxylate synthase
MADRFREPLVPSAEVRAEKMDLGPTPRRTPPALVPDAQAVADLATRIRERRKGLIYFGHLEGVQPSLPPAAANLSAATGYPVVAEATSRLRGRLAGAHVVDAAEALFRSEPFTSAHRPGIILRFGAAPLTRAASGWLDSLEAEQVVVSPNLPWPDPGHAAKEVLSAGPTEACVALAKAVSDLLGGTRRDSAWADEWSAASIVARTSLDDHLDGAEFFEGTIARDVLEGCPPNAILYVAPILSVRAVDAFTSSWVPTEIIASRGVSGIDGTISAAANAALSRTAEVMFAQKSARGATEPMYRSIIGVKPAPKNISPPTKM